MALEHDGENFTRWTHVENGQVLNRRLHRIEIQANDGRLHVLEGDKLPDFLQTCTGHGYKGLHTAQVLLSPGKVHASVSERIVLWPSGRDFLHVVLGFVLFIGARIIVVLMNGDI